MTKITIKRPDDWHVHFRDGKALEYSAKHTARQFARTLVMPNLVPPVTTAKQAEDYRSRIMSALPKDLSDSFDPKMALYLTDETTSDHAVDAAKSPHVLSFKLYPAGATTNSADGLTDIQKAYHVFEKMEALEVPLCIHGEVTHPSVDIFDREARFIEEKLKPICAKFPGLKIVFEHITTKAAVDFVRAQAKAGQKIAATITPQHLLYNRNAMLVGGIRPHYYCLPILKREKDRSALVDAAISGETAFFLGTDSAPHATHKKEAACGCAGVFSAYSALELYATVFDAHDALDKLEGFASIHGANFYDLPVSKETVTLEKLPLAIPNKLDYADGDITPFLAGETLEWRLV